MAGVKGRSGRRRKPLADLLLSGGYRKDRHGALPPGGAAAVLQMPMASDQAPMPDWLGESIGQDGRAHLAAMWDRYEDFGPGDLRLLRGSAEVLDRLAELRRALEQTAVEADRLRLMRHSRAEMQLFAGLMRQLAPPAREGR